MFGNAKLNRAKERDFDYLGTIGRENRLICLCTSHPHQSGYSIHPFSAVTALLVPIFHSTRDVEFHLDRINLLVLYLAILLNPLHPFSLAPARPRQSPRIVRLPRKLLLALSWRRKAPQSSKRYLSRTWTKICKLSRHINLSLPPRSRLPRESEEEHKGECLPQS